MIKIFNDKNNRRLFFELAPKYWLSSYILSNILLILASNYVFSPLNNDSLLLLAFLGLAVLFLGWCFNIFRFIPGYLDTKILILLVIVYFLPLIILLLLSITIYSSNQNHTEMYAALFSGSWFFWHVFFLARDFKPKNAKYTVAVYGGGVGGRELVELMRRGSRYSPKYIIDDDQSLMHKYVVGLRVLDLESVQTNWSENKVDMVFVAIPSLSVSDREKILQKLTDLPITVKLLPHVDDLIGSSVSLSQLEPVSINDILNRPEMDSILSEDTKWLNGKKAVVTGGAGSIGLELSLRLIRSGVSRLNIIDHSEIAIVEAKEYITEICEVESIDCDIRFYLASASDKEFISNLFAETTYDFVFHAAAYKHVPLLEDNEVQGVKNNLNSTATVLSSARETGVRNFVLVSTDKAVRPVNIMGASKRLCEALCLTNTEEYPMTTVSVVRFGNVLGSSGSVLPYFENQISKGGPVTVTHRDMERYFMSISEAASLVIKSTQVENGPRLFVLDMGQPVKILDFAKKLIRLHGYEPYVAEYDEVGTMEIQISGLRSGEKLFEELSIGELSVTKIEKLYQADESFASDDEVYTLVSRIEKALTDNNPDALRQVFTQSFIEFQGSN